MNSQNIVMCVVALILGMLLANMLKSVCGCKVVEGAENGPCLGQKWTGSVKPSELCQTCYKKHKPTQMVDGERHAGSYAAAWETCGGTPSNFQ